MNAKNASVVIIENQPLMLAALSAALIAEGFTVLAEVSESRRAIQKVMECQPRAALFSVGRPSLPDMERIAALRHEFPATLILALVSGEHPGQERMAFDYGAHSVVSKAASRAQLLTALIDMLAPPKLENQTTGEESARGANLEPALSAK